MHLDICWLFSFMYGLMIDTVELYSLDMAWMTKFSIQTYSCMREQNLLHSFSSKFLNAFEWNLLCYHKLLVCSSLYYLPLHNEYQGENLPRWFNKMYL